MPVNPVHTDNAPAAIGAYSQATLAEGFLFTSGQLGLVPATHLPRASRLRLDRPSPISRRSVPQRAPRSATPSR